MNNEEREEVRQAIEQCRNSALKAEVQVNALADALYWVTKVMSHPMAAEYRDKLDLIFQKAYRKAQEGLLIRIEDQDSGIAAQISELLEPQPRSSDENTH